MSDIKKLKEMMEEPADKSFFKKHGSPEAIKNHPLKHQSKAIEEKIKTNIPGESRKDQVSRINKQVADMSLKEISRSRHARRHQGASRTSKSERAEDVKRMSQDYD